MPARKATRFMSSAPAVLEKLGERCKGDHQHQQLVNGRAKDAALYPPGLCKAMIQGIDAQRKREGNALPDYVLSQLDAGGAIYSLDPEESKVELDPDVTGEELCHEQAGLWEYGPGGVAVYDELTGEELAPALVRAARKEEVDFMLDWDVWEEVPVEQCRKVTGKGPLGGRWVDVNKGDSTNPNVRSRYVAKEIAYTKSDDFFAAMPPLEALRLLISSVATSQSGDCPGGTKLLVIDARKAHLHASPERDLFVELPPEVRRPGMCGRLKRCLYGTRDAQKVGSLPCR